MILNLQVHLRYRMDQPTDLLMQIEAAATQDQIIRHANINVETSETFARVAAADNIGERIWLRVQGDLVCDYSAEVEINRQPVELEDLNAVAPHRLPAEIIKYMMPSRYCPSDEFQSYAASEFGNLEGGARIAAIRNWIAVKFRYVPGSSNAQTSALDTFVLRQGVCRDFAQVLITLARASTIPARMVSAYAPFVSPPDFHAVAEVYLDGQWHLVDPTGMASAENLAVIGVGLDSANIAFLTSYGQIDLIEQSVQVTST